MLLSSRNIISRRTLLKSSTATLALPMLEAMIPVCKASSSNELGLPPRIGFFYFPHGALMDHWTPDKSGLDFDLKPVMSPLEKFKDQLTIVSGLENSLAAGFAHANSPGTWLKNIPSNPDDPFSGFTLDQLIAQQTNAETNLSSIALAAESCTTMAGYDWAYGCPSAETISFQGEGRPVYMETNAHKLFNALFDINSRSRINSSSSLLDSMLDEMHLLSKNLGASDKQTLDEYYESIRQIERVIFNEEENFVDDFDRQLSLKMDLILLAWRCNLTRVSSMMMAAEGSTRVYQHLGLNKSFHELSHHENDKEKIAGLLSIQKYHTEKFSQFVEKLSQIVEGEYSMLDNSILVYGSNMSDSNIHSHHSLPTLIVGKGKGSIRGGGQHLTFPEGTPVSNLMLTLLDSFGIKRNSFGNSTGRFSML